MASENKYNDDIDPKIVIEHLNDWFMKKLEINSNFHPRNLEQRLNMVIASNNFDNATKLIIHNNIMKTVSHHILIADFCPKQAPVFPLKNLINLAKNTWNSSLKVKTGNKLVQKMACVHLMLCIGSSSRWADINKVRWEDLIVYENFVSIRLRISKSNRNGSKRQYINIAKNINDKNSCPVRFLFKYKKLIGNPSFGFCFHSSDPEMPFNPDAIFNQIIRQAKFEKWKILPSKHSARVSAISAVAKLGASKDKILRFGNWVSNSNMPNTYISNNIASDQNEAHFKILEALD